MLNFPICNNVIEKLGMHAWPGDEPKFYWNLSTDRSHIIMKAHL